MIYKIIFIPLLLLSIYGCSTEEKVKMVAGYLLTEANQKISNLTIENKKLNNTVTKLKEEVKELKNRGNRIKNELF